MAGDTDCDCTMHGSHPQGTDPCHEQSENGNLCSKVAGHDGPHAACNPTQHPIETWGGGNE